MRQYLSKSCVIALVALAHVVIAEDADADLVLAENAVEDVGAASADIAAGVVLTGAGTIHGPDDPGVPWVIDGAVLGLSIDQPIVLTGFIKGTGTFDNVVFDGEFAPGHSPALVTLGNTIYTASNVLEMELGGVAAGSQHDKIVHNGMASLSGTLDVVLLNMFAPQLGNAFDLFDWNAGLIGTFSTINLPAIGTGLAWDTSDIYVGGQLSVTAVPEVSSFFLGGMCLIAGTAVLALKQIWRLFIRTRARNTTA
jgi:hypothetical protein